MLKRFVLAGVAAGAMAVPFAGAAWAQPAQPPVVPPGVEGNGSTCIVDDVYPSNLEIVDVNQGSNQVSTKVDWREAGQLQVPLVGPLAGELGVAPGQTVNVYCTPAGFAAIRWNPQAQPTPPGQPSPMGQQNPAQQNPQGAPTALGQQNPQGQR